MILFRIGCTAPVPQHWDVTGYSLLITSSSLNLLAIKGMDATPLHFEPLKNISIHFHQGLAGMLVMFFFLIYISHHPRDHHHPRLCAHRPWLSCSRRWPIKVAQRAMTSTANAGGVGRWSRGCVGWHFQVQFHLKPKKLQFSL